MPEIRIRDAVAADVPAILAMIRGLALFEKAPDSVLASEADLLRHGFGDDPSFHCLIALVDGEPAGMALWFRTFSTWTGKPGIYLEDLFVEPSARRLGIGERLMRRLAAIAIERGCARLDLQALDWNPARGFYERLGMQLMDEWVRYRAEGETLRALARGDAVLSSAAEEDG